MDKLRLRYEQTGRAAWISHLDMMRTLQRALSRAQVPLRYSEGFNPHAQISVLLPLSVGMESLCQLADIRVREELDLAALPGRLNRVLPEGVRVTEAYEGGAACAALKWLRAEGLWEYAPGTDTGAAAAGLGALFAAPSLFVTRRTKRGEGPFDLAPHLRDVRFRAEGAFVRAEALVSASEPVVNPELLAGAARENAAALAPAFSRFRRRELYTEEGAAFR